MTRQLCYFTFLICFTTVLTKNPEPDLPPCPTNFQFLPQNLPMHCKMPNPPNYPAPPFPPPFPPYFSGPVIGKQTEQSPAVPDAGKLPAAPALPPAPVGVPMPMGMGPPMPMGMPGMPMGVPGMPMGMPGMPMGMPMLGGPPQSKLPVIVMPFYSPDPSYKNPKAPGPYQRPRPYKRKIRVVKHSRHHHFDTETSSDTDSSDADTDTDTNTDTDSTDSDHSRWNWKNRRSMRRRKKIRHERKKEDYLTPILQYVSKDGYVIFEKQISKGEAKHWLGDSKDGEKGDKENSQASNKNISKDEGDDHEPMKKKLINKAKNGEPDQTVLVKYNKRVHRVKPDKQTKDGTRKTHLLK